MIDMIGRLSARRRLGVIDVVRPPNRGTEIRWVEPTEGDNAGVLAVAIVEGGRCDVAALSMMRTRYYI